MLELITKLLYPNTCGICKRLSKENICPKCKYTLKKLDKFEPKKCRGKKFEEIAYLFDYTGEIRQRLIEYKFLEAGYLYKTFAEYIIKNKRVSDYIKNYDIIIPIPVHKKRKKQRGYNQTELIAKELSKNLQIEMQTDILTKEKNTKPQSTLNKEQRKENAKNVYALQNYTKIQNKKILLLDDIYTTGSTVNECSRILSMAQPTKIGILTIAKD